MLPVLPAALSEELGRIRADRVSGAMALARRAAAAVLESAGRLSSESVQAAAQEVARAQPMMAPLAHLALRLRTGPDAGAVCREFIEQIDRADARIAEHTARLLVPDAVVLTHSYSGTVAHALAYAHRTGRLGRVIATESRPMREGLRLAADLASEGVPVDLIVDAAAGLVMPEVHIVLAGADWIFADAVVNKIGTRLIALAARERGVPAYTLASELKFAPAGLPPPVEDMRDPAEVAAEAPGFRVRNYYFEATPRIWFSGVVTERGSLGGRVVGGAGLEPATSCL